MKRITIIILLGASLVTLLPTCMFALEGTNRSLYAIFNKDGYGYAIYWLVHNEWVRTSDYFQTNHRLLNGFTALPNHNFVTLIGSDLVLLDLNGFKGIISHNVEKFDYNQQRNVIYVVAYNNTWQYELKMTSLDGSTIKNFEKAPPLGISSNISSYGDNLIVEGTDKNLYIADVGDEEDIEFSMFVEGANPTYSNTGEYFAFTSSNGQIMILDIKTGEVKALKVKKGGPITWIEDDTLVYGYQWKGWFMIEPIQRIAMVNVKTGQMMQLPGEEIPLAISWVKD